MLTNRSLVLALLAGTLLATSIFMFTWRRNEVAPVCTNCSVILISIDTLRPDHLGCYGYNKETSPHIDQFRRDSALFTTAIAQAPSTEPSHASLFTSVVPSVHGAFFSRKAVISPSLPTIGEIMKESGFRTASFNGGGQINGAFGFARGFETYQSFTEGDYTREFFTDRVSSAIEWLRSIEAERFFLFLHSYEIHHPYSPADEFLREPATSYRGPLPRNVQATLLRAINKKRIPANAKDKEYVKALYDAEIRSMDRGFGRLIDFLKSAGLYENSLIILTSDHGEEFDEHGSIGWHSHTLYDELLKIPLIIKFPHSTYSGYTVDLQVRSIDVLPTILELIGVPALEHFQGSSLIPLLKGADKFDDFAVSQKDSKREIPPSALRTKEWKLNMNKLYDLTQDPGETKNLASENTEILKAFKDKLEQEIISNTETGHTELEFDQATLEQLKTLGYID